MDMTAIEFQAKTGRAPEHDDLKRVNCDEAGRFQHKLCGWCPEHDQPRPACGCVAPWKADGDEPLGG